MYKALVRSHLDYCDTIYHTLALNSQIYLGVTLDSLMEKVERTQYQAALAITGTWQGTNRSKLTKSWDGKHFLTVVGAGAFFRYTKLKSTRPLLKLPPLRRSLYRFNNSNTFQEIRCKIARYKNFSRRN